MNWTEGSLARHSRRKGWNQDASRQKEYFAKARSRKRNDAQTENERASNFVPSYMTESAQENAFPLAFGSQQRSSRRRLQSLQEACDSNQVSQANVQPINWRKRATGSLDSASVSRRVEETLDAKRAKLLETADWSGVTIQKPLVVTYPSDMQSVQKKKKHQRAQRHDVNFSGHLPKAHASASHHKLPKVANSDNMIIRIGSEHYGWSPSKNTIKAKSPQDWRKNQPLRPSTLRYQETPQRASSALQSLSSSVPESQSPCVRQSLFKRRLTENWDNLGRSIPQSTPSTIDGAHYVRVSSPRRLHHPRPTKPSSRPSLNIQSPSSISQDPAGSLGVQDGSLCSISPVQNEHGKVMQDQSPSFHKGCHQDLVWSHNDDALLTGMHDYQDRPTLLAGTNASSVHANVESSSTYESPPDATEASFLDLLNQVSDDDEIDTSRFQDLLDRSPSSYTDGNSVPCEFREVEEHPALPVEITTDNVADNDAIWQEFVFGSTFAQRNQPIAEPTSNNTRTEVGSETSVVEAPTGPPCTQPEPPQMGQDTALGGPTAAPSSATPPQTISTEAAVAPVGMEDESVSLMPSRGTSPVAEPHGIVEILRQSTERTCSPTIPTLETKKQSSDFKFHQPSTFIGRFATAKEMARTVTTNGQQGPRKARKKRETGRPDIRALPNIEDDPIECTP